MMSKNPVCLSINDKLFDDVRLDILNWTNKEIMLKKLNINFNEELKYILSFEKYFDVLVSEINPNGCKPYYTFQKNNTYYAVYMVTFGSSNCVKLNDYIP